jgi:hypothetical protein
MSDTAPSTVRASSCGAAIVDQGYPWRPMHECGLMRKVLLLTRTGVAVLGQWDGRATWCVAWAPLPMVPTWLRAELDQQERMTR